MFLTYFDEVKFDPPVQNSHLLGGLTIAIDNIASVEEEVNKLSAEIFGTPLLNAKTEFHGAHIFQGKGIFKGMVFESRLEILRRLVCVIDQPEIIYKTYVQIIPENLQYTPMQPEDIGFMYFVEQVDELLAELDGTGLLFGDYDDPVIGSSVASLSQFRTGGTFWKRSKRIDRLVDTVHFAHSHHSRLIQLADIFIYCIQFTKRPFNSRYRELFAKVLGDSALLHGCRTRVWPLEPYWYR